MKTLNLLIQETLMSRTKTYDCLLFIRMQQLISIYYNLIFRTNARLEANIFLISENNTFQWHLIDI
jgi:hypothetical protein